MVEEGEVKVELGIGEVWGGGVGGKSTGGAGDTGDGGGVGEIGGDGIRQGGGGKERKIRNKRIRRRRLMCNGSLEKKRVDEEEWARAR